MNLTYVWYKLIYELSLTHYIDIDIDKKSNEKMGTHCRRY